ncbi:hypothetical protein Ancab_021977 [Ancistrocladus abbreviatus]
MSDALKHPSKPLPFGMLITRILLKRGLNLDGEPGDVLSPFHVLGSPTALPLMAVIHNNQWMLKTDLMAPARGQASTAPSRPSSEAPVVPPAAPPATSPTAPAQGEHPPPSPPAPGPMPSDTSFVSRAEFDSLRHSIRRQERMLRALCTHLSLPVPSASSSPTTSAANPTQEDD